MKALIQRVRQGQVVVDGSLIGAIEQGIVALIGVDMNDDEAKAEKMLHKLLNYRIFSDESGKMNLSLRQVDGGLLLVSQFTLSADTRKGLRPSFSSAAPPAEGERIFNHLVAKAQSEWNRVATGEFGADMQVSLINDGPVTFLLEA